jgi:RNA polymerase sigma-70 factor (ECF subfamily)
MRVYLSFHTFEGRSNIYSWLTRIAINSALMLLRRRRTRPETLVDFLPDTHDGNACVEIKDPSPTPEQAYEFYSLQTVVMRKLNRLEPHLREPIQIQMTQGCSINEIAQRLNISKAAVKSRLHRARQRLSSVREVKRPIILHRDYLTPPIED